MTNEQVKPTVLSVFRGEKNNLGRVVPKRRVGKCLFYETSGNHVLHIDRSYGRP